MKEIEHKKLKAISLFSGAGGDTRGMEDAGLNVVGFVEYDKEAIKTHKLNFQDCKLIGEDITQIKDEDLTKYKGKIDIIFGGFPCTPFSKAGKQNPEDKRNQLYLEFIRIVNIIEPKIIIAENVEGLKNVKNKDGKSFKDIIIDDFKNQAGYFLEAKLYNTIDFGVPQKRKRFIFIGSRDKKNIKFPDIKSCDEKISNKDKKEREVERRKCIQENCLEFSLENALKINKELSDKIGIPDDKWIEDLDDITEPSGKPATNLIKCSKFTEVIDKKGKEVTHGISFKKRNYPTYSCVVDKNDYARTITARYDTMPRLFVPVKNKKGSYLRTYTVNEAKQIQGFPENFNFEGVGRKDAMKQIGNAVPPLMIERIVRNLFTSNLI